MSRIVAAAVAGVLVAGCGATGGAVGGPAGSGATASRAAEVTPTPTTTEGPEGPEDASTAGVEGVNAELVTDFYTQAFVQRDVAGAARTYLAENYIQHNPTIADGRDEFIAAMVPYLKGSGVTFRIGQVIASGDVVVVHAESTEASGARFAVADFFRVEGGKIAEHWDVIQAIPATSANGRPMVPQPPAEQPPRGGTGSVTASITPLPLECGWGHTAHVSEASEASAEASTTRGPRPGVVGAVCWGAHDHHLTTPGPPPVGAVLPDPSVRRQHRPHRSPNVLTPSCGADPRVVLQRGRMRVLVAGCVRRAAVG